MFVGCAALSLCPRRLAMSAADTVASSQPGPAPYRSPFAGWEDRASVRTSPRRFFTPADAEQPPISADLVPVAGHPDVRSLEPERLRLVLLQHLYRYLDFTVALESMVVNRTVLGIASGRIGVPLPPEMRLDAYRIYSDEAYHALFSADLRNQVEQVTGIAARLPDQPYFLGRLNALLANTDPAQRDLVELLFVVVSETLISATLAEYQTSGPMADSVRAAIRDHAVDEGRHHKYFASFLMHLWPHLDPAERTFVAQTVPALVAVFLDPDVAGTRADLLHCGVEAEQADQIVAECFAPDRLAEQRQAMARQTLRYFAELGAFVDNESQDNLHAHRLAVP
jgi:hypothetical protein